MTILLLIWHFFKTGLFAIGGGLATIPFLYEISDITGWFSHQDILNMIAVAESTPGPIGVNMATYAGYMTEGIPGAILSTLALVAPSIIIGTIVFKVIKKFRTNKFVNGSFEILRPASTALIAAAGWNVILVVFFDVEKITYDMFGQIKEIFTHINWISIAMFVVFFLAMKFIKKDIHPIIYIAIAAVLGIVFKL